MHENDEVRVEGIERANQEGQANCYLQPDLKGVALFLILEVDLIFQMNQTPAPHATLTSLHSS